MKVLVDGRVLSQGLVTGVQRYAREMVNAFREWGLNTRSAFPAAGGRYHSISGSRQRFLARRAVTIYYFAREILRPSGNRQRRNW